MVRRLSFSVGENKKGKTPRKGRFSLKVCVYSIKEGKFAILSPSVMDCDNFTMSLCESQ